MIDGLIFICLIMNPGFTLEKIGVPNHTPDPVVAFCADVYILAPAVSKPGERKTATALAIKRLRFKKPPFIVKEPASGKSKKIPHSQMGVKPGDPPGSEEPEQKKTNNGKEYRSKPTSNGIIP
jgi:hypothetical protein